jgi:hypothetical protein
VLDPAWNPADDNQSVDRCYRIGQLRDVIVYRLISTETVEDKIYKRQVFKQTLSQATIGDAPESLPGYFAETELKDLLRFPAEYRDRPCETLAAIKKRKGLELPDTPTNRLHSEFLENMIQVEGITNHGALFSGIENPDQEEDADLEERINAGL